MRIERTNWNKNFFQDGIVSTGISNDKNVNFALKSLASKKEKEKVRSSILRIKSYFRGNCVFLK